MQIKFVDFGNSCYTNHHFTENIQTREYRSPEVILGLKYHPNTDIWSLACIIFELLTGDYLFRPSSDNPHISKDEEHLSLMFSTLGKMPKHLSLKGRYARNFLNKGGNLLKADLPEDYSIAEILHEEFGFTNQDAHEIMDFLMPMLHYDVSKRSSAAEALRHEWLWK